MPSDETYAVFLDDEMCDLENNKTLASALEKEAPQGIALKYFTDAVDCWEFLRSEKEKVRVFFCDYSMPEVDGMTFLSEVFKLSSAMKCVVMTGWAEKVEEFRKDKRIYKVLDKDDHMTQNISEILKEVKPK